MSIGEGVDKSYRGGSVPGRLRRIPAGAICSIELCNIPVYALNLCNRHYKRQRRNGDPLAGGVPRQKGRVCSIENCLLPHEAKGFCKLHYQRFISNGDPLIRNTPSTSFQPGHIPKNKGTGSWFTCVNCGNVFYRIRRSRNYQSCSIVCRSKTVSGDNHPMWQGGITSENSKIRHSAEYKKWRRSVFSRDNFTCQFCGVRGGTLHADHIDSFAEFPEKRFLLENGRTLCFPCHKTTPTYGGKKRK